MLLLLEEKRKRVDDSTTGCGGYLGMGVGAKFQRHRARFISQKDQVEHTHKITITPAVCKVTFHRGLQPDGHAITSRCLEWVAGGGAWQHSHSHDKAGDMTDREGV